MCSRAAPSYNSEFTRSESHRIAHQTIGADSDSAAPRNGLGELDLSTRGQGAYAEHSLIAKWPVRVTE